MRSARASSPLIRRFRPRRWAYVTILVVSALSVPAFALTSMTLNSTPAPREFDGWAAVFTQAADTGSRVLFTIDAITPDGRGAHPVVDYGISACGRKPFTGVLVLAGDARINASEGAPSGEGSSLALVPGLTRLTIADEGNGSRAVAEGVQVFRVKLDPERCLFAYRPDLAAPPFNGLTVVLRGPLRGRTVHDGFAPLGLWPVRQTQSWPLLGQVPVFARADHGAFRFGSRLPGRWFRPFQSYVGLNVGRLRGKTLVDFARPEPIEPDAFAWAGAKPIAVQARVTDSDHLNRWQTLALASGIWLGIGGSILATVALELLRRDRRALGAPRSEAPVAADRPRRRPAREVLLGLGLVACVLAARRGRRR